MRAESKLFLLGLAAIVLVHCAKGTSFVGQSGDGGNGEGASDGASTPAGGSQNTGGTVANGASAPDGGSGASGTTSTSDPSTTTSSSSTTTSSSGSTTSSSSSSSTTSSSSSSSTTSSSSSSSTTSSSSSSSTSSSSSSSSSSTGGGPVNCAPKNPGAVCLASEHCFPAPDGVSFCQGPVGLGVNYDACNSPGDCTAALQCVDTGDAFGSPCCLRWCTSDADCGAGFETCEFLSPSVYVGATEYGVCYDGLGGC